MDLVKTDVDVLLSMSYEEKLELILKGTEDKGQVCEYGLLLGSIPEEAIIRADFAAELYLSGRVRRIIVSGGVVHEHGGRQVSECDLMAEVLTKKGVPESAIIRENCAETTRENMIYGVLLLNRETRLSGVDELMIITSVWHMTRSLAIARGFLPRKLTPVGVGAPLPCDVCEWLTDEENRERVDNEIRFFKNLVNSKIVDR